MHPVPSLIEDAQFCSPKVLTRAASPEGGSPSMLAVLTTQQLSEGDPLSHAHMGGQLGDARPTQTWLVDFGHRSPYRKEPQNGPQLPSTAPPHPGCENPPQSNNPLRVKKQVISEQNTCYETGREERLLILLGYRDCELTLPTLKMSTVFRDILRRIASGALDLSHATGRRYGREGAEQKTQYTSNQANKKKGDRTALLGGGDGCAHDPDDEPTQQPDCNELAHTLFPYP